MSYRRTGSIEVDQFIRATPARVWAALTDPETHARWWAPGDVADVVGHEFHLEMPGFGSVPCRVVASEPHERLVYTFNEVWTLTWRLVPEGDGTRLPPAWQSWQRTSPLTAVCRSGAPPRSTWSSTRSA
jgi:uncharacterized protein YndB with AHSA1/START domain